MGWSPADIIGLVTGLLPLVLELVKLIESIFKTSSGETKKVIAMSALSPLISGASLYDVSLLVDTAVAKFNDDGTFSHSSETGP